MSVAVSRWQREHRSSLAATSWRNRRVNHPSCSYALRDLVTLCTLSLRPRYDQGASGATVLFRHSQPWRFCYALGVLAKSRPCSSALLKLVSLFWILGPILSSSIRMKSHLPCSLLLLAGHRAHILAICLRIIMDGPRTFWPSDSVLGPILTVPV